MPGEDSLPKLNEMIFLAAEGEDLTGSRKAKRIRERANSTDNAEAIGNLNSHGQGYIVRISNSCWTSQFTRWILQDHKRHCDREEIRWYNDLGKFRRFGYWDIPWVRFWWLRWNFWWNWNQYVSFGLQDSSKYSNWFQPCCSLNGPNFFSYLLFLPSLFQATINITVTAIYL